MTTDVQIKISYDPRLVSFIRQYPIWYKRLNRNPLLFREFNEDMKTYKLAYINRMRTLTENQLRNVIDICKDRPLNQKEVSLLEDFFKQSF